MKHKQRGKSLSVFLFVKGKGFNFTRIRFYGNRLRFLSNEMACKSLLYFILRENGFYGNRLRFLSNEIVCKSLLCFILRENGFYGNRLYLFRNHTCKLEFIIDGPCNIRRKTLGCQRRFCLKLPENEHKERLAR